MIPQYQFPPPPSEPLDKSYPKFRDWLIKHSDRVTNSLTTWLNQQVATPLSTLLNGYGANIASATTIVVTNMVHNVTGAAEIDTINQPTGSSAVGPLTLISVNGFTIGISGNVTNAMTVNAGHAAILYYHPVTQTWTGVTS